MDSTGSALFAGSLRGSADFGGGSLSSVGGLDTSSAKLDAAADHVFSRRYGDGDDQKGLAATMDGAGNGIVTGAYAGTLDFGGGLLASAGAQDVFLVKLAANGDHLWSKRFGDEFTQIGHSVAADKASNVLLTGQFYGAVDFGNGPLHSAGSSDIFVAKFSP